MSSRPLRQLTAWAFIAIVSTVLAACGSSDTSVLAPQDAVAPAVKAADTTRPAAPAKPEDAQVSVVEPAAAPGGTLGGAPADKKQLVSIELKPVDGPAAAPVPQSESASGAETAQAKLLTSYTDYGFSLKLDLGAEVQASGWTEPEPSVTQGIVAFSYGGVNANLVWGPNEDRTALTFLADTYNILRASQPSVTFESISDGEIAINDQAGVYGGFKAMDANGAAVGGGLIGAWVCEDNGTAFRMTLTGEDATVVQLRFDRLLENFACSSS